MLTAKFGIEVELTGVTREETAEIVRQHFDGRTERTFDGYDAFKVIAQDGRVWKVMSDASICTQRTVNGKTVCADKNYSVELVSPILTYREDIADLQELVRKIRRNGGFTNNTCGIHIHLDGVNHSVRSIRNFINIIASKNDLFYKALDINPERIRYCKKMDEVLVNKINNKKPKTIREIEELWYEGYSESTLRHYHSSRYHFLNFHSLFTGNHTVELRGFNSTLHAGKIRSFIVLALALNHQALTQKCASSKKPQTDNEKFAMRTYLNRIGLIGDEFANCREHLTASLDGSSAWRFRIA